MTDGIYVVRTSLPAESFDGATTVRSYKSLALVERAFRCIKTVDLQVRPVYPWLADRVRAHVFLCMLAYHLEWHMRERLAPMLFDDTNKQAADAQRTSVVAQAQRSPAAVIKQTTGLTPDGLPVHPIAAGRSGDAGAQYRHHRHRPELSDHRADRADSNSAQGIRASWRHM